MNTLKTYEHPEYDAIIAWDDTNRSAIRMAPGEWVKHRWAVPAGYGMLVAVNEEFVTVLWSQEPKSSPHDELVADMAQQIRDEEDNEIMRILTAHADAS